MRKLEPNAKVELTLLTANKLKLVSGNSKFNLLCMPSDNFPLSEENIDQKSFEISSDKLLKLLNKTKISISNDETRHYLNGIYLHKTKLENRSFLSGVATDSHRLSSSSIEIDKNTHIESIILPKKTIFQLISLLEQNNNPIKISNNKSKIKFEMDNGVLISKVIDGRFPDYSKVIPKDNDKVLHLKLDEFRNSIERVTTVSSDRTKGLKMAISKDAVQLSVNNPSSGEGIENIKAKFKINKDVAEFFKEGYVVRPLVDQGCVKSLGSRLKDKLFGIVGQKFNLKDYHKFVQNDDRHIDIHFEMLMFLHETELHLEVLTENMPVFESLLGPDIAVQASPHLRIARPAKPQDNIGFHSDIDYGNTSYEMNLIFI